MVVGGGTVTDALPTVTPFCIKNAEIKDLRAHSVY